MPGDPFKPAQAGQPLDIPAAAWNALLGLLRPHPGQRPGPRGPGLPPGCVYVVNATEGPVERFGVLGLDAPLVAPSASEPLFLDAPALNGITPTATHWGRAFAVMVEPVDAGNVGVGMIAGTLACTLNIGHEDDRYADVDLASSASLKTAAAGGCRVLWKEAGTGAGKRAVLSLGHEPADFTGITSAASRHGDRWTYTFGRAGPKTAAGHNGWAAGSGALTGYNAAEYPNAPGAAVWGNGVRTANVPDNFDLSPVPDGSLVRAWAVPVDDVGIEYWFVAENVVDGTC